MADREKLKRERAGTYVTADGRFTVEQSSSGWLVLDAEQTDELGLPRARGPFGTLDDARDAIADARSAPAKVIELPLDRKPRRASKDDAAAGASAPARAPTATGTKGAPRALRKAPKRAPAIVYRELRTVDGEQLRALWTEAGFRLIGDDDLGLARMARRNPGLLWVAAEGTQVVGSALGAWDGRRGWIYHVATAASHRRQGIATTLVDRVEAGLRNLGCPKVSVLVRDENADGAAFWDARRYERGSRQFARELRD